MTKKYIDHLNELSSQDIFRGFLECGLFPDKMPPMFQSTTFYNLIVEDKNILKDVPKKPVDYMRYENIRHTNIPRYMGIPEPFNYAKLCKILSDQWEQELKTHFKKNTKNHKHKISRIHIQKLNSDDNDCKCTIFKMSGYDKFKKDQEIEEELIKSELAIGKKYLVKADISNCFPSIYTHSIPWALVEKEKAKKNRRYKEYYNKIDEALRYIKHGESNGILIGPHTSNLISEIILVKVDNILYKKGYQFIRHIDDYECYVETREKGEQFLRDLAHELKHYELKLNEKKCEILELPQALTNEWPNILKGYVATFIENKKSISLKNMIAFWNKVINLATSREEYSVINYAIKVLKNYKESIKGSTKNYYINKIHDLLLHYPYLAFLIDKYFFEPFEIDKELIKKISEDFYLVGKNNNRPEAMAYAIFWAIKYNQKLGLQTKDFNKINELDDAILWTIAYLYSKKFPGSKSYLNFHEEAKKKLEEGDFTRYWLFVYEVLTINDFKAYKKSNSPKNNKNGNSCSENKNNNNNNNNNNNKDMALIDKYIRLKEEKISFIRKEYKI